MSFQYTYDTNGKAVGVFVPINEWEKLTGLKKGKTPKKTASGNNATRRSIAKGMQQVGAIEKGELQSVPLQQLLNEL